MKFLELKYENGIVRAEAIGHGTDVLDRFHTLSTALLGPLGPWRITDVSGFIPPSEPIDSKMRWSLQAQVKNSKTNHELADLAQWQRDQC